MPAVKVDLVPDERPRLLGADPGQQGQDHVGLEPVGPQLDGSRSTTAWPSVIALDGAFLPFGDVDQARDVAPYLVAGLGLADRALKDLVDEAEPIASSVFGALIQPVVSWSAVSSLSLIPPICGITLWSASER